MRKLRVILEHLPPESATKTALRNAADPEDLKRASTDARADRAPWSSTEMLLAAVLDAIRINTAVTVAAGGGKPGKFEPTPRPGVEPTSQGRRELSDDQRRALDPRLRNQPQEG